MPLEWKLTKVGETTITHWKKHDAGEILAALAEPHIEEKGETPPVRKHGFKGQFLAVRKLQKGEARMHFETLRRTAEKKTAVLETPVALVEKPRESLVATLWKKDTVPFPVFLRGSKKTKQKEQAAKAVMRALAKLHAAGFTHGHLALKNIVVDSKGNAKLVDYTRIQPLHNAVADAEAGDIASVLAYAIHFKDAKGWKKVMRMPIEIISAVKLGNQLESEYKRRFKAYLERMRKTA